MKYDFTCIHKFSMEDTNIVLDINSGIVHTLSKEAWEFLEVLEKAEGDLDKAVEDLKGSYSVEELDALKGEFEELIKEGLLFSYDKSLENYQPKKQNIVKALCLHVAHDCNMRCKYCFAGTGPFGADRSLMDLETGKRAFDFLFEASGSRKYVEVDYFGGEPLLNFKVVKELVKYGKQKAQEKGKVLRQTLTTNALLLNQEVIDFLNEEDVYLILSLDGRPEIQNQMRPLRGEKPSFDLINNNIKKYVNSQADNTYYVRGTYTHYNLDFCKDILFLVDQGYDRISIEPVVTSPENNFALREEDIPILKEEYQELTKKWLEYYKAGKPFKFFHFNIDLDKGPCVLKRLSGCGAGNEYLAVSPKGDLYPCHQFMENKEFLMGNIYEGVKNERVKETFLNAHVLNKEKCSSCWAKFFCSGGCHANAYFANGDFLKPYELGCELQRTRLECAIYIQTKIWEEKNQTTK